MSNAELFRQAAERGDTPLLPGERLWGFWEFTYANSALAIATWAFLIGGATAAFVGPREGIAAVIIGNILGVMLVALPTCLPSGKYGVEQFTLLRSTFGRNGSRLVYALAVVLLTLGWLAVLGMMFGRSVDGMLTLLKTGEAVTEPANGVLVSVLAAAAIVVTGFVVARGPTSIKFFNMIMSPALVLLMFVMMWLILGQHQPAELLGLPALAPPTEDKRLNFMIAVEVNMAAGFSWWPYLGNLARLSKNERTSFWPNVVGVFGAASLGEIVGLLGAAALGNADPTIWMTAIGGVAIGIVALGFIAFANVTSMINILYTSVVGLRQLAGPVLGRLSWDMLVAAFCVVPLVVVFWAPGIYDGFFIFLVWTSALNATLAGIGMADYFVLRRQHISLRAVFASPERSPFAYWGGFNPIALTALVAGSAVYVLVFNPQTLAAGPGFTALSASMPAFLAAAVVQWVGTRMFGSRRFGDYGERITSGAATTVESLTVVEPAVDAIVR
ncbi:purine-cytosine permease family protein [Aromatoleum toluclasticum]|uniref:purine-cytosine permease family protein n=1 Tax=Aromatoleum toluclasticum TaxID=92003 RepID=UPI0003652991|nr:cytosine permease [Aromatoleum toluclasticum]